MSIDGEEGGRGGGVLAVTSRTNDVTARANKRVCGTHAAQNSSAAAVAGSTGANW